MNRRQVIGAGVGVAAMAAGAGVALLRSSPDDAPGFWDLSFEQPGGGSLAMAGLRGKPLLVNFWATWCPPCVKEMPLLDQFHAARKSAGWQVLGLAVDGPTPVREFLAQRPMGFLIGLAGMEGAELSRSLGNINGALPFTVVFNGSGKIVARKLGAISERDLSEYASKA
jgi:thiol-disulfide isomerase/thioredoxin